MVWLPVGLTVNAGEPGETIQTPSSQGGQTMITLNLNGKDHELDVADDMPLLWALRDVANLTGTK